MSQSLVNLKEGVRSREDSVEERLRFLDGEKVNNVEAEKRISVADRSTAKLRLDHQQTDADRDQFQNEASHIPHLSLQSTHTGVTGCKRAFNFLFEADVKANQSLSCCIAII